MEKNPRGSQGNIKDHRKNVAATVVGLLSVLQLDRASQRAAARHFGGVHMGSWQLQQEAYPPISSARCAELALPLW